MNNMQLFDRVEDPAKLASDEDISDYLPLLCMWLSRIQSCGDQKDGGSPSSAAVRVFRLLSIHPQSTEILQLMPQALDKLWREVEVAASHKQENSCSRISVQEQARVICTFEQGCSLTRLRLLMEEVYHLLTPHPAELQQQPDDGPSCTTSLCRSNLTVLQSPIFTHLLCLLLPVCVSVANPPPQRLGALISKLLVRRGQRGQRNNDRGK